MYFSMSNIMLYMSTKKVWLGSSYTKKLDSGVGQEDPKESSIENIIGKIVR